MKDYSLSELRAINEAYSKMNIAESDGSNKSTSFFEDWYYGNDDGYEHLDATEILSEFMRDKERGINRRKFDLIPADQYANALRRFMKQGPELFDFPESILDKWLHMILHNLSYIENMTSIAGHDRWFPNVEIEEFFYEEPIYTNLEEKPDLSDYGECTEFLDSIGFYDWCVLPDGSDPWSDYGPKQFNDIFDNLKTDSSTADKLVAINRCLDIVHCRGDLSSAFIEGGRKTLTAISN